MKCYWNYIVRCINSLTTNFFWEEQERYSKDFIEEEIFKIAEVIRQHGLSDKLVGVCGESNIEQFILTIACGLAGAVPCPAKAADLDEFATSNTLHACLTYESDFTGTCIKIIGANGTRGRAFSSDGVAMAFLTSGTSGSARKIVFQSHAQLFETQRAIIDRMALPDGGVELILTPFDNCYWFGRVRCSLSQGRSIITIGTPFNPLKAYKFVRDRHVTGVSCDSATFEMIHNLAMEQGEEIFNGIEFLKVASGPLNTNELRMFLDKNREVKFYFNYGLTEAMRCSILVLPEEMSKLGSVGRPLEGVNISILDIESHVTLSAGSHGEVATSGVHLSVGYNIDKGWETRFVGPEFKTGDYGYVDEDGYLYILGRTADILRYNGTTVHPAVIEAQLYALLNQPFCVVRWQHETRPKISGLLLVTEDQNFSEQELHAINKVLESSLGANHKLLGFACSQKMPRTNNGKIKRADLLESLRATQVLI